MVQLKKPKHPDLKAGGFLVLIDTNTTTLTNLGEFWLEYPPAWSPDGRYVAIAMTHRNPVTTPEKWDLYILDIETKNLKQITFDGQAREVIDWIKVP